MNFQTATILVALIVFSGSAPHLDAQDVRLLDGPKTVRYNYGIRVVVATGASAKDQLKSHFKPIFKKFGQNSMTKITVVSGPEAVQMRNGRVAGKQWVAISGEYRFKLTIEDATGAKLEQLVGRLEKLPSSYMSACVAVSDKGEDGIAIYADLGGARAHGGKGYINLVPHADALVIAHEAGHTLEQVATQSDPKILDKWEAAIKADQISVSDYGDKVRHEDLGEFAQVYAVCLDAGPEHLAELKKLSPKRFALWQRILTPYSPEALEVAVQGFGDGVKGGYELGEDLDGVEVGSIMDRYRPEDVLNITSDLAPASKQPIFSSNAKERNEAEQDNAHQSTTRSEPKSE